MDSKPIFPHHNRTTIQLIPLTFEGLTKINDGIYDMLPALITKSKNNDSKMISGRIPQDV